MSNENQLVPTGSMPPMSEYFGNKDAFEHAQRVAKMLSASDLIPKRYQGKVADVMIGLEMANRLKASPVMVMQNLYVVHGNPGWSGQFVTAAVNSCGKFKDDLEFEFTGTEGTDEWGCRAFAETRTGKMKRGAKVTIRMAKAEGWYNKTGSKWQTMPEQMLMYRAASFFSRAHCPEVLQGMQTIEEINDFTVMADTKTDGNLISLVNTANLDESEKEAIINDIEAGLTEDQAQEYLIHLLNNQVEPITHGGSYSASDIQRHLNKLK